MKRSFLGRIEFPSALQSSTTCCILSRNPSRVNHAPGYHRRISMPSVSLGQVAVHLRPEDNIAVAAQKLQLGLELQIHGTVLKLCQSNDMGHMVDCPPTNKYDDVIKYGQVI